MNEDGSMFKKETQPFESKKIKKKEERTDMSTKALSMPRPKISSTEFSKHSTVGEIRRVGKSIVVVDESGAVLPISYNSVKSLRASALRKKRSAIIRANGLSRAQVGRIVGDLKEGAPIDVYIRKVTTSKSDKPQVTNFEILLMDENKDEN